MVRARVLRADVAPADCGYFHHVVAREYEVLEVLEGTWDAPRLFALQSCPVPGEAGRPSGIFRLELSEHLPRGTDPERYRPTEPPNMHWRHHLAES